MNKVLGHLKTIIMHKHYVFLNCCKAGLVWRGIKHDLSKFSPIEFGESVKYFVGYRSPIDVCKEKNGHSLAWQHHKGRNTHHYEYWVDYLDDGGIPIQMPFEDALEMMCDFLGAGMAYSKNAGKEFSYESEYEWWENKISKPIAMHEQTKTFCQLMFANMQRDNSNNCLKKKEAKVIYDIAENLRIVDRSEKN